MTTPRTSWPLVVSLHGAPAYWYSSQCGGVAAGYYRSSDGTATGRPIGARLAQSAPPVLCVVQTRLFEDAA